MKRSSLFRQLFISFSLLLLASLLALSMIASSVIRSSIYRYTENELDSLIVLTQDLLFSGSGVQAAPAEWDALLENWFARQQYRITIMDSKGLVLGDSKADAEELENHRTREEIIQALSYGQGAAVRYSESIHVNLFYKARSFKAPDGQNLVIRSSMPVLFLNKQLNDLYIRLLAGSVLILAAAGLIVLWNVRRISNPILQLVSTAKAFSRGDLEHRYKIHTPEELRVLSNALETMAEEIRSRIHEVEFRRNEAEAVLSAMSDGVIVLNRHFMVNKANSAAKKILGLSEQSDPVGKSFLETFRSTDLKRYAEQVFKSGEPLEGNIQVWTQETKTLQVYASIIRGQESCLLVLHDITRLLRLENIRKDFVANVSHELRTPITAIKGFVETLRDGALDDPEKAKRFLGIIHKHADRLECIVEDLLSLARLEQQENNTLETSRIMVKQVLENSIAVCENRAEDKNIRILVSVPEELQARLNASLIEQAIINLLDNAIKYSPEETEVQVKARQEAAELVISIQDQGRGIPVMDIPRIFERFYRVDKARSREEGGTGLGLSIVKHIVSLHGGTVSVESTENKGSFFIIHLPLIQA